MATFILGSALAIFSLIAVWDAARITSTLRVPGAFDLVGPDRYLLGVAILVGALGGCLMLQSLLKWQPKPAQFQATHDEDNDSQRHIVVIGALALYAVAIPILGYLLATFAFALATFRTLGLRDWRWIVLSATGVMVGFYFAFAKLADMALPTGIWEIG